jgi:archaeosine synthase
MLEVTDRAGLARTGKWTSGPSKVDYPNILFHDSPVYPAPRYAEMTIRGYERISIAPAGQDELAGFEQSIIMPLDALKGEAKVEEGNNVAIVRGRASNLDGRPEELFVLGNAFELRRDARAFVESIVALREAVGYNKLIYAPGLMEPSNLALLAYCGVDLFDSSLPLYQASRGRLLLTEGTMLAEEAPWLVQGPEQVADRNLEAAWNELQLVRHMIKVGRLRELVETRANASPWMVAALRILDLYHYDLQEKYAPVVGPPFYCNSKASLFRPDVWRFRRRIMERWEPAPHKKVLLLIPCSAKKPYFTSKSHRMFEEVLLSVPNSCAIQELIITSPLGAVPRELELYYPAAQYDIPVTGNWDREEVAMVQELVQRAASFGFLKIISHLGAESEFVGEAVNCVDTTGGENTTGSEALARLRTELVAACEGVEKVPRAVDRVELLRSEARFQFGKEGGALLDGCSVVGKYPYLKIMKGNVQLGMLTPERGMLSLTMDGGKVLVEQDLNVVQMGDFDLTGNLFAVGVTGADPRIRPGDEVAIVRRGELEGVGVAVMSGAEMTDSKRGEAVRVRHKRKR